MDGDFTVTGSPGQVDEFKFYYNNGNDVWEQVSSTNADDNGNRFFALANSAVPRVFFSDKAPGIIQVTNLVTFGVNLGYQILSGAFLPGGVVEARGSFQLAAWTSGFALTNDPTSTASNLYTGTYEVVNLPGAHMEYSRHQRRHVGNSAQHWRRQSQLQSLHH